MFSHQVRCEGHFGRDFRFALHSGSRVVRRDIRGVGGKLHVIIAQVFVVANQVVLLLVILPAEQKYFGDYATRRKWWPVHARASAFCLSFVVELA